MPKFIDRVASEATEVRPVRMALTALAALFYALGWLVGLVVVAVKFAVGAVRVGIADARERFAAPGDAAEVES